MYARDTLVEWLFIAWDARPGRARRRIDALERKFEAHTEALLLALRGPAGPDDAPPARSQHPRVIQGGPV